MTENDNRGLLRVIKVPFDVKAIFLGAMGYILFVAGGWLLNAIFKGVETGNVISRFIHQALDACSITLARIPLIGRELDGLVGSLFGAPSRPLAWWEMLIVGIWFLLILAIFGGAICRIIALRIARDDSSGARGALKFSSGALSDYLCIPLFLGIAIAFFVGCNALAGLVIGIPVVGPILMLILMPLAILSAIIILLLAVGGVLGLFLMVAAVSAEKNGTLDAISRALSYLYSRPVAFFFYYFLVYLVASLILLIGHQVFLPLVANSVDLGIAYEKIETAFRAGAGDAYALRLPDVDGHGYNAVAVVLSWIFMILLKIGVLGFVVTYILGGSTAIYFALRRDVDGTEDSEIYVEGADDEDDFGLPPVTPPPAEGVAPASPASTPTAPPAAPPAGETSPGPDAPSGEERVE